ncbi:DUF2061 domain-containing protein [Marinomonas colpomeniae]|uniref:DUF2061 domain-containing protein n=1 Tax=Marinomonas colpomeniae TaxID=2774408 RepID=A0ABR8P5A1_9GAMM|nr:DUF2061 domain-containing protein [Marinomonas colpomeniae]MBD5772312.1 DUF2061 domain-containing protein [Marinomonas colpomeniae]
MTKTITFAVMHFTIAFSVAYLITGSFIVGGLVAIVEPAINTVAYYFHEIFWNKKLQQANREKNKKIALSKGFQAVGESYALRAM